MLKRLKRFVCDWWGNYIFFCPLVIVANRWWDKPEIMVPYLIASIPLAAVGGYAYAMFLKHVWYPLWREQF